MLLYLTDTSQTLNTSYNSKIKRYHNKITLFPLHLTNQDLGKIKQPKGCYSLIFSDIIASVTRASKRRRVNIFVSLFMPIKIVAFLFDFFVSLIIIKLSGGRISSTYLSECVCVWEWERERQREKRCIFVCMCVCFRESVCVWPCVLCSETTPKFFTPVCCQARLNFWHLRHSKLNRSARKEKK